MIPKIGHLVWNHRRILESDHPLITNGLHNLIKLNPDWKIHVYIPEEVDKDLKSYLSESDFNLIKDRHFVSRTDLWRYFKMYYEGGLYMDLDRMVNIPLSEIVTEGIKWVIPTTREYDFSVDIMLSAPENPAFANAFKMYLERVKSGWKDQYFLGPQTYMHAVSYTLCGEIVNTDPGVEKFQMLREKISQLSFAKTFREVPYNDMLVYKGDKGDELEMIKRDFYAKEGIKHWTGDW